MPSGRAYATRLVRPYHFGPDEVGVANLPFRDCLKCPGCGRIHRCALDVQKLLCECREVILVDRKADA